jgi:hypothetical protein
LSGQPEKLQQLDNGQGNGSPKQYLESQASIAMVLCQRYHHWGVGNGKIEPDGMSECLA